MLTTPSALATPSAHSDERQLSAVDVFCMQTYQPSPRDPARRVRVIAVTLGFVSLVLLGSLGFVVSQASAMERERDLLANELRTARAAQTEATLAAKDVERSAATLALETSVRRDIVDERMLQQERRSAELGQLAEQVEREKLVKADCVTPRSILGASNL